MDELFCDCLKTILQ